jgi:hypothetical protein
MKKYLAMFAALGLCLPMSAMGAQGDFTIDNRTSGSGTASTVDSSSGIDLLRRDVEIQVSAGVYLDAGETTAGGDIAVGTAHSGGNAAFAGSTAGGTVQEYTDSNFDPSTDGTDAQSAAQAAWDEAGS